MRIVKHGRMTVRVEEEVGLTQALYGVGLSYGLTSHMTLEEFVKSGVLNDKGGVFDRVSQVAAKLSGKDGGHNKFLEAIAVWLNINAPRYWWQEFDTYRVGVTKQSESTIHTITHKYLTASDFCGRVNSVQIELLNTLIKKWRNCSDKERKEDYFIDIKEALPEGFLQRRLVVTNYKTLRNIYFQRRNHKLPHWHFFIQQVLAEVLDPQLITATKGENQ